MKQYRVRLQTEAMEDLDQAYLFAARNAPETAARWYNRFYDALQTLRAYPRTKIAKTSESIYHGGTENTEDFEYRISNKES